MRDLPKIKCGRCGLPPRANETICEVCFNSRWIRYCKLHDSETDNSRGCKQCVYLFKDKEYFEPVELASAMVIEWEEARRTVQERPIDEWAAKGLGELTLADLLKPFCKNGLSHPDRALTGLLAIMNPDGRLHWMGCVITQGDFVASGHPGSFRNVEIAAQLLDNHFAEYLRAFAAYRWLADLCMQCHRRAKLLGLRIVSATPTDWWWLLASAEALNEAADLVKNQYVDARSGELRQLFVKRELTEDEALILSTTSSEQLLTVETAWRELITYCIGTLLTVLDQAKVRPCSRKDLENLVEETQQFTLLLRKQKEQFRERQAELSEPPELLKLTYDIHSLLRGGLASHDRANAALCKVRECVRRGHIKLARSLVKQLDPELAPFPDLNADFLINAEAEYQNRCRKVKYIAAVLIVGMILIAILIKLTKQSIS